MSPAGSRIETVGKILVLARREILSAYFSKVTRREKEKEKSEIVESVNEIRH